jgi:RNA polymerase sigma-70 factor, ECF subfamily
MALEDAEDVQLFTMALAGAEAAFTELYRRWQGNVFRFALRVSNSASIAEDVTQEVFLTIVRGTSGFDPALGSFSAYMYGIARNHILRRKSRELKLGPGVGSVDGETDPSHAGLTAPSDPLTDFARREMMENLHRAVAALPLRYREVVVLCELQELNYADAARVIGCPEGTVRSRLHRARLLLTDKLREQGRGASPVPEVRPARCLP